MITFGSIYALVPWLWKRERMHSPALVEVHFWLACARVYVMQVRPDKIGLRVRDDEQGWYNDIDMARLLPKEVEQVRAVMAATNNVCPPPRMVTVIEGTLL